MNCNSLVFVAQWRRNGGKQDSECRAGSSECCTHLLSFIYATAHRYCGYINTRV